MNVDLERLIAELRRNSKDDIEFAQRVALVYCKLIEDKQHPLAAIQTTFAIEPR